jgi:predicted regulator of Ras-like GTPase activity (Roadblock/LC7/MglB family)
MSFSEFLKEAVDRVDGAVASIILASDGIPVDEHVTDRLIDFHALSAEASTLIKDIEIASQGLNLGQAQEFALISDTCGIFMRKITDDYYLALVLRSDGNFGKARFVLRTIVPRIEPEF